MPDVTVTMGYISRQLTHIIGTQAAHTRAFAEARQDLRMLKAAVNDISRDSVTPGEVAVIHDDLNTIQARITEFEGRLVVVEGDAEPGDPDAESAEP